MMAAVGDRARLATVIIGRPDTQADAGSALHTPDLPDQHYRDEHAAVLTETRGEVRYFD